MAQPTPLGAHINDPVIEEDPGQEEAAQRSPPRPTPPVPSPTKKSTPATAKKTPTAAKKTPKSTPKMTSPESEVGTSADVEYLETRRTEAGPAVALAKTQDLPMKTDTGSRPKDPVPAAQDFSTMDFSALVGQYFDQEARHARLQSDIVYTLQKRHQVNFQLFAFKFMPA